MKQLSLADDLDSASSGALKETQKLLVTPDLRNKAIEQSSTAQLVDAQVRSLAGNDANAEEIYKLSSQIFADLVKESGGDSAKLTAILAKAKDDPKSFFEHISDQNKQSLHKISSKITTQPTTVQSPPKNSTLP